MAAFPVFRGLLWCVVVSVAFVVVQFLMVLVPIWFVLGAGCLRLLCWLSLVVVGCVIVMVDVISGLPLCCFLSWDFCCFGAIGVFGGQLYFVMVSSVSVVVRFLAIVDSDC